MNGEHQVADHVAKSPRAREIGLGIIGSGRIGTLRARLAAGHAAVTSITVSDLDPANAEKLAGLVGGRSHGADNLAVIDDPAVTAVIVSTSEGEHLAPMLAALERGKPVLVEKPIALTLQHADAILGTLARTGGTLRVGTLEDLRTLFGITTEPVDHLVQRWIDAMPQYGPGHIDLIADLRAGLPAGLAVAGGYLDGIGVPACVASGTRAAASLTMPGVAP